MTFNPINQNQCVSYPNLWQHVYEVSKWSDIIYCMYCAYNCFKRLTLTYYPVSISSCHKLPMCEVSEWLGKIKSVSNPQCFTYKVQKVTLTFASDKKSIEFLLSIWWTYVWSLKVIGQNCKSVSRLQGKSVTESRIHSFSHVLTQPRTNGRILFNAFSRGKWVGVIMFYFSKNFFSTNLMFKETFTYTSSEIQHLYLYLESRKYLKYYYSFFSI